MIYRRRPWSDIWHFREDCQHFPRRLYREQDRPNAPTYGTLCDQCQSIQRREIKRRKYDG